LKRQFFYIDQLNLYSMPHTMRGVWAGLLVVVGGRMRWPAEEEDKEEEHCAHLAEDAVTLGLR
jgi:hypothetical protein